jgi:Integral membrane protein CcmA involved in cell shape determination
MGFFKELKSDLSQAVNELLPEDNIDQKDEEIVDTLSSNEEADNERMKQWLEEFAQDDSDTDDFMNLQKTDGEEALIEPVATLEENTFDEDNLEEQEDEVDLTDNIQQEETDAVDTLFEQDTISYEDTMIEEDYNQDLLVEDTDEIKEEEDETMEDNVDLELLNALNSDELDNNETEITEKTAPKQRTASVAKDDEVTVIAKGTTINGSITSDGALDVMGTVNGDVECLGKLSITGKLKGNTSAAEVYVNTERMEGSIMCEGSVKVGLGTVVLGDITATSGVIAGAVKGEIDVNGPIIIDSTAIIKGNIKAKSVQINNGAVIEGFCSLSYSEINVDNIFE